MNVIVKFCSLPDYDIVYICRPESLGIVVGIVFLVVAILFQYFNLTSDSNVSLLSYF